MKRRSWKILACLFALLAAAGAAWLVALAQRSGVGWPGGGGPASLTRQVAALEREVDELRSQAQKLPGIRKHLSAAQSEARALSAIVPKGNNPESLAATIQAKAREAAVTPRWIQIRSLPLAGKDGKKNGGDLAAWRYSLLVEGDFDQLASFMNGMEQLDQFPPAGGGDGSPFFEITDLNISGDAAASGNRPGRHQCTLVMFTYRPDGEWSKRE